LDNGIFEPLVILLSAMAGGFCSSAPLGAINLYVTDRILAKKDQRLRWYLAGVIGMDCVHASLAAWGYHAFFDQGPVARWASIAGGAFLIILGSLSLRKKAQQAAHAAPTLAKNGRPPLNDMLLGAFMCGANPAFLMFWVFAIDQVERHVDTDILGWRLALFLLGVATGDGLWFTVLLNLVRRGREAVKPRVLASVRATIAAAFVLVGGFAIYHGFKLR
jgi:threonine/homoserine/homoserine lactone efflux protein